MGVSKNSGFSPQIIHFNRVSHYKPSVLGYHYFWKHPYRGWNPTHLCGDDNTPSYYRRIPIKQPVWLKVRFFFSWLICFPDPHFFLRFSGRGIPSTRAETEPGNQCIPRLKSGISYRYFRRLSIQFITSPKTNVDTQNNGLEKVTPLQYGHFWYLC